MRISTSQIYLQGIQAFGNQQSKLSTLQQQISTGIRINRPSDDPAASARVLELQQTVTLMDQYNTNISLAEARLNQEETALNALENIYFRINELTIQANTGSIDATGLKAISTEIEERYKELLSLANSTDYTGNYLFAGFQNQSQPFAETQTGAITHVEYSGDQGQRAIQVSPTRQITTDDSGSRIFLEMESSIALKQATATTNTGNGVIAPAGVYDASAYTPGNYQIVFTAPAVYDIVDLSGPTTLVSGATYTDSGSIEFNGIRTSITGSPNATDSFTISPGRNRDIFSTVNFIVDTMNNSSSSTQRFANLAQAQTDMETFFNNVLDVRTSIGGRLNALQSQFDENLSFRDLSKATISTLRDTDLATAISQLSLEQTTLDAAQAIFARITSSSLFNFLR